MHRRALAGQFLPLTAQHTCSAGAITRTKYFFSARYVWHKDQHLYTSPVLVKDSQGLKRSDLSEGIRVDVSSSLSWMKEIEKRLVQIGALPGLGWANQVACNIYHTGDIGLSSHFDDPRRFTGPVVSLRLFSASRLSFGCKLQSQSNGNVRLSMIKRLQGHIWLTKIRPTSRRCSLSLTCLGERSPSWRRNHMQSLVLSTVYAGKT